MPPSVVAIIACSAQPSACVAQRVDLILLIPPRPAPFAHGHSGPATMCGRVPCLACKCCRDLLCTAAARTPSAARVLHTGLFAQETNIYLSTICHAPLGVWKFWLHETTPEMSRRVDSEGFRGLFSRCKVSRCRLGRGKTNSRGGKPRHSVPLEAFSYRDFKHFAQKWPGE